MEKRKTFHDRHRLKEFMSKAALPKTLEGVLPSKEKNKHTEEIIGGTKMNDATH